MRPDITLIFPKSKFLLDQAVFPPLGIMYLSAYLKQHGLNVQCLDMGIGHTPDMAEAETIGISFTTPQKNEAFWLAKSLNHHVLIAGGPHATHAPEECFEVGFDYVIKGYAERNLLWILSKANQKPKYKPGDPEIDTLPYPDRDALPIKDYKYEIDGRPATVIMTSRGCPFSCAFCARISHKYEMQSAWKTINEINSIHSNYGFTAFMIFDDVFVANEDRLSRISMAFRSGNFKFRCFVRSNLVNPLVCELLKNMGVVEVGIGIESGSDKILKQNMKGTTRQMNTNAVKMLNDHGIRVKAFIIIGLPGEDHQTVAETISWIECNELSNIDVSIFQPLPGSPIFKEPEKYGIELNYNGQPNWYKGIPGDYLATARTKELSECEIVNYRDQIEKRFKRPELLR